MHEAQPLCMLSSQCPSNGSELAETQFVLRTISMPVARHCYVEPDCCSVTPISLFLHSAVNGKAIFALVVRRGEMLRKVIAVPNMFQKAWQRHCIPNKKVSNGSAELLRKNCAKRLFAKLIEIV